MIGWLVGWLQTMVREDLHRSAAMLVEALDARRRYMVRSEQTFLSTTTRFLDFLKEASSSTGSDSGSGSGARLDRKSPATQRTNKSIQGRVQYSIYIALDD